MILTIQLLIIRCTVLVIHGLEDVQIPVSHGLALYDKCRHKVEPLFLRDADHNNIRTFHAFFRIVDNFLQKVDRFNKT